MKKTFYLLTQKNFINQKNGRSILDVGVFIEKIILSTGSEDFKEYSKEISNQTLEQIFENYEDYFMMNIDDVLKKERKNSHSEEFQIYSHLLLDEEQYKSLMIQTENILTREVLVNELI